jgi:hypothetical protein
MVLVHDRSRESSFIDLVEVDMGWSTRTRPFFPGWIAFQNFLLADLELGGKKVRGEKKVSKQVERKGARPLSPSHPTFPL